MKLRVTGLALAVAIMSTMILPGFASEVKENDTVDQSEAIEALETEPQSGVYLDEELLESVEYRISGGVCYVTVESFVTAMNGETMVEEEDGTVTVSASTVTGVVDVEEGDMLPENGTEAEVAEADVVEETLSLTATLGDQYIVANGRYLYAAKGVIELDGKIAVPVRTIAEAYNLDVAYKSATKSVYLTSQEDAGAYLESGDTYYDEETLYWLSRIIYCESGNQSLEGRLAVGNVVMNRVENPRFPNTVYDVIFQRNQFSPASSGSIYRTPSAGSVLAAKLVMDGAKVVKTALFFNRAGLSCYASRNCTYVTTIGDHAFYK